MWPPQFANANTPGFSRNKPSSRNSPPRRHPVRRRRKAASESVRGANANAAKAAESRPNGVGLASELTDNLVYKAGFNLSANVVKAADQALGSLIDVKT